MAFWRKLSFFASLFALSACGAQQQTSSSSTSGRSVASSVPIVVKEDRRDLSHGAIPDDAKSIKVALLVPLSGESASVGNAMLDAATMALYDSYLAVPSGQIRTKIVLIPKDTGNNAAETIKSARQAIEQGASFFIGPLFSQSAMAIKPVLEEKSMIMLSFSNNKAVASPNLYTFGFLPEQQVARIAEYAYLNKLQRVALLAPNDAYGEKIRDTLSEIYVRKGGQLSPAELYAPSQANVDAAVSRLAGAYNNAPEDRRFQAIFIANSTISLKSIIKSMHKNNIDLGKVKLLGAGMWDDDSIANIPEMNGALFPSSSPQAYEIFENRFMTAYGYKPVRLAALAYDAMIMVAGITMYGGEVSNAALTNRKGFLTPANGLVRLMPDGTSQRKLSIMEITANGFKEVERADRYFSDME